MSNSSPSNAVAFFGVSLVAGIACRHVLRGTRIPYTVALLIIGIIFGCLEWGTNHQLGKLGDGIRLWANINPDLLLAVFLPALLFESSYSMEVQQIKRCMAQMLLLAGPGVVISTLFLGSAVKIFFPLHWSWKTSFLLGGILSATDPVAVVALLKELGASKKLSTIIEGESLMNDSTAIVVYQLLYKMILGQSFSWLSIIKYLPEVSLGAVAIGLAFGIASVVWLGFIFNDVIIEIALTLAVSYMAYFTAQEDADVSGVLAVITLGMFYAAAARTYYKGESQQGLHHFWGLITYIANTLVFILSGVVIAESILRSGSFFHGHGSSWGYLLLLYIFVLLSRFMVVVILYPLLCYFGHGLNWKEACILIWSGLRGAVSLSLSISIKRASDNSGFLDAESGKLFVFFTGGIVFLTLIANGSTTQFLLHILKLDRLSDAKKRILEYTKYEMLNKAMEAFRELGDDEELGPVDWPTVKRHIRSLNNLEEHEALGEAFQDKRNLDVRNITDIRVRLLNGVQSAYWRMLEEGRIQQNIAGILMQSVDEAIERAYHGPLCDWESLKPNVSFPHYFKLLRSGIFPKKLVVYMTVERLESACFISAAFLRAHRIARRQLLDFIGGGDTVSMLVEESESEGEEARRFMENVRLAFPQVLQVLKTRQVTFSVLKHLIDYVQDLEKTGLLEEKEMFHLHDAVQADLKRHAMNPRLIRIPELADLISAHPLLGVLPPTIREELENSAKEVMKLHGVPLYSEGGRPKGIWLVCNGTVKSRRPSLKCNNFLMPTFTHGTTLGLYEVLVGKRHMCDMVTDSVVLCFFIERKTVLSVLGLDPAVDDFLWQESTIVIAKLLIPQLFEWITSQDMRSLIVERSIMTTYLRGQTIELAQHTIAFLLEGLVRAPSSPEDLISSPAALLSTDGRRFANVDFSGSKLSNCFQGCVYQVDVRARVIKFDVTSIDTNFPRPLRRTLSLEHSQSSPNGDHGGLMSWPEGFYKADDHHISSGSLSARAMQLSIYGSLINSPWDPNGKFEQSKSLSSSKTARLSRSSPLLFARSEGPSCSTRSPGPANGRDNGYSLADQNLKNNSSDNSSAEDEVVVSISSPSHLSFQNP